MVEFKKRKQTDGIQFIEKPKQKPVKINVTELKEATKEREKQESLWQRFLNFFKKNT